MTYSRLAARAVEETVERLEQRIRARFPHRNLPLVASHLREVVASIASEPPPARRNHWVRVTCRVITAVLLVGTLIALVLTVTALAAEAGQMRSLDWVQAFESIVNDVVFAGIAVFFLWALPNRLERHRALSVLHRLRSMAHVIDMHQLTKNPERFNSSFRDTPATIQVGMTAIELANYFDYCSEMLSLIGKAAALFAEESTDSSILATVSDIEELTTGMSRKIWQKVALLPLDERLT